MVPKKNLFSEHGLKEMQCYYENIEKRKILTIKLLEITKVKETTIETK